MRGSGRRRSYGNDRDLNSPIARRRRMDGNSASTRNAGMERLSKEEQEQRDAQMARELQREEEELLIRQQELVIEPTLSPGILSLILRDSPSANQPQGARRRHTRRRSNSHGSVEITGVLERPLPRRRGSTGNRIGNDRTLANNRNNILVVVMNSTDPPDLRSLSDMILGVRNAIQSSIEREATIRSDFRQLSRNSEESSSNNGDSGEREVFSRGSSISNDEHEVDDSPINDNQSRHFALETGEIQSSGNRLSTSFDSESNSNQSYFEELYNSSNYQSSFDEDDNLSEESRSENGDNDILSENGSNFASSDGEYDDSLNGSHEESDLDTVNESDDEPIEDSTRSSDSNDESDDEPIEDSTRSSDSNDESNDGPIEDSTRSSDSKDDNDSFNEEQSVYSTNSDASERSHFFDSGDELDSDDGSLMNARIELGSTNDSDIYDGELTLGDGSEVSSEDSDSGDDSEDSDESMSVDTSGASGDDEHGEDIEDSTNDEESDGNDSDSSISSHSSNHLGNIRHFLFAHHRGLGDQIELLSNMMSVNENRERRSSTPPEDPPDETVIQCSDWGQCTICFEEAPYDPVGCLHCQQLIGCKICVNRWFRGGRPRVDSPLSLGQSGLNHRQCPLCRHEYQDVVPEVGSMFELAPKI